MVFDCPELFPYKYLIKKKQKHFIVLVFNLKMCNNQRYKIFRNTCLIIVSVLPSRLCVYPFLIYLNFGTMDF